MIKAVVLDVDGVIVGDQRGVNFPLPNARVMEALKKLHESGVFVSLCTGKAAYGIEGIIRGAHLDNLHITDGGAVGIDPLDHEVSFEYAIDRKRSLEVAKFYLEHDIYFEFYTSDDYFVLKDQVNDLTRKHADVLQKEPQLVDGIAALLSQHDIVKMVMATELDEGKNFIASTFGSEFGNDLDLNWTFNSNLVPWRLGLVTLKGVSKKTGVENISKHLAVPLENMLGVGDTMHDWAFIGICGYGATLAGADEKLQELVSQKGDHGFIGGSVNDDGILDILRHFKLL